MQKVTLLLNGTRIKDRRELPAHLRGRARKVARQLRKNRRYYRPRCAGFLGLMFGRGTNATLSIRTSSSTETCVGGLTNCVIECWGSGGGGGGTTGSGCGITAGGGGASGSHSHCTFAVSTQGGHTWTVTIGAVGAAGIQGGANGGNGGQSSIAAGTVTGFNTITCPGGGGGTTGGAAGTAGGVPTNTNAGATNTNGNNGSGINGGAGIGGVVSGDGSPYGAGGQGHGVAGGGGNGNQGFTGAAVFGYS